MYNWYIPTQALPEICHGFIRQLKKERTSGLYITCIQQQLLIHTAPVLQSKCTIIELLLVSVDITAMSFFPWKCSIHPPLTLKIIRRPQVSKYLRQWQDNSLPSQNTNTTREPLKHFVRPMSTMNRLASFKMSTWKDPNNFNFNKFMIALPKSASRY